jgi:hypothetical protein
MFKIGDWVQITPSADLKWHVWKSSKDIYNEFAGKIGILEKIDIDEDRPGQKLLCVRVDFPYGLAGLSPGSYYEWFRPEHLIRSSKYNKELKEHRDQSTKDLQDWEAFKVKSTNDILRKVFGNEPIKKVETIEQHKQVIEKEQQDNDYYDYEHLWGMDPSWNYDDPDYVSSLVSYQPPIDESVNSKQYENTTSNSDNTKIYAFDNSNDCKKYDE